MHVNELMKEDIHLKKKQEGIWEGLEGENGRGKVCNHIIISKIEEKERKNAYSALLFVGDPGTKTQRKSRAKPTLYGYSCSKPTGI